MRYPAALASLCNQWRILQTSQPRSSAPSQLVTRSNLTHGKQVANHVVLVPVLRDFTILDLETTLALWLKERPSLNSTTSVGRRGIYFTSLNTLGILPNHSFSDEKDDLSIIPTTGRQLFLTRLILSLLLPLTQTHRTGSREIRSAKPSGILLAIHAHSILLATPLLHRTGRFA